ncbi:MAG: acyl CoA:acetate/3-ketoacid CoA transferase [Bernardetiaceae bacterium]|nr:acyl CoA:acetate/3-ketoacid CoA transferase [Bernardetiaceae bacterium]
MLRNKIVSAQDAVELIKDGDTVLVGGFIGAGFAEHLAVALEERFVQTAAPKQLSLVYAAGQGDGKMRGLNHFAHEGLLRRVIGGHFGLAPKIGKLALQNKIEAYNLPQGIISQLFRDIAAGKPGLISKVGLHTFVDPALEGGKINTKTTEDLVKRIDIEGDTYLFYKTFPIQIALLRGTTADPEGNITMEKEALILDSLAAAQAVKNSGGVVIVQVERITTRQRQNPQMVVIPGILVDAIVVAPPEHHDQTFAEPYNPAYTGDIRIPDSSIPNIALDERKIIARRAAMFLKINAIVNLGIGMPEGVASVAKEENILDYITLTVEPGGIGGIPAAGLSFGAVANADAIIPQPSQFDFYDGGGLDQAFLGMAEADGEGNVNVSRFHDRLAGAGGFINISQNAKSVYFLGTFTTKAQFEVRDGKLHIIKDTENCKFLSKVSQITYSGKYATERAQTVYYITERAVFKLTEKGMELIEIAPGIDLQKDILDKMGFVPIISDNLKLMDARIFEPALLGLRREEVLDMKSRCHYEADKNLLFMNLEGIDLYTAADVKHFKQQVRMIFDEIGKKFNVIINYDNFFIGKDAENDYFEMLTENEQMYFLSSGRYSSNAFFRRSAADKFAAINAKLYANSKEAFLHF